MEHSVDVFWFRTLTAFHSTKFVCSRCKNCGLLYLHQYRLDICLFPYSCSQTHQNQLQGFQFRTFGVASSGDGYPKQAVTDLLPCSFYTYEISTSDQSFLFYNGSFQTTFSMEDFDLNLHDFSGEYGKYHTDTRPKL